MSATEAMKAQNKPPLSSKTFLLSFVAIVTSKMLLAGGLLVLKDNMIEGSAWMWWWMITLTICVTFLEVGLVLGLQYTDRFVRVAAITVGAKPTGSAPKFLTEGKDNGEPG